MMTETPQLPNIKRRTIISTFSLFFQSGYSAFLGLIANLILTILLSPTIFGIYITVLSIIALLNYFSDFGLAASLIQKKEITDQDLKTTFTTQQAIILTLLTMGFFASSFIKDFYKLPQEGVYLYWALLVAFFVSSLKTIPSILLERKIQFQKIVLVQIIENTVFYTCVITLALMKFSLMSFTYAVLLRSVVGLILIYSFSFWAPGIGFSYATLRELMSFGIPFQASSFLALFKDDLITLYLGKILGFEALGYIGWAKKWAETPIRIVMDNLSRVTFSLLARFQDNMEKIRNLTEKILYYQTAILAPALLGLIIVMKDMVAVIPKYNKWEAALPMLYIFAISSLIVSFSAPFMNVFNSLGRVKTSFSFMLVYTILLWILTPLFINRFGMYGFPLAHLVVSISYVAVLIKAKSVFKFQFTSTVYKFLLSALIMTCVIYLIRLPFHNASPVLIAASIITGIVSYAFCLQFLFKVNIASEMKSFYNQIYVS